MSYFENMNEMMEGIVDDAMLTHEAYLETEAKLVDAVGNYVTGADVTCAKYGDGKIVAFKGTTLEDLIVDIEFAEGIKKFSLVHIMNNKFIRFADILEVGDAWDSAFEVHTKLTGIYRECERVIRQQQIEAEKQAEAEKKAEAKYQKQKEQAVKSFDQMVQDANTSLSDVDEFYYALGWLANHIGSMTAILPDYLGSAFEKHFGAETPKTLVDGRAKTSGGYAKQWSWEFKCTIKKLKETVVPARIQSVTTDFSKGIHNTAFLWDLVSNYGFQFGKKQDVDKIREAIPTPYISSFETGLTA